MKWNRVTLGYIGTNEMEYEDAAVGVEADVETPPRVDDHTRHLHVARVLQGMLQAFVTGTDRDDVRTEDRKIRTALDYAETYLAIPVTPKQLNP